MAETIETLSVKLEADSRDFNAGMEQAKSKTSAFSSMATGALMGVGMAAANMAIGAAQSFASFAMDGVNMASDLNETISKSSVVFGDNAGAIQEWASTAATALGQSQNEAIGAAATFGNLFVSMGMGKDTSADMSMNLVQLATDLASFNNIDPSIALEKLRAGLLGEAEPMRALGVNINAAMVSNKALEMGLAATTKELTPAMLAQARYALILEQTTTAQGDFARTSDGLANQQRIQDAQWKELQTTIGTALLPVLLAVTQAFNKLLKEVLPPLAAFIKNVLSPAMQGIGNAVGPSIKFVIDMFQNLGTTMQAQADGPMAYLFNWFNENMPRIQRIVQNVTDALTGFWRDHGQQIMAVVGPVLQWLVDFWTNDMKMILDIVTAALQLLEGDFSGAGETLQGILSRWQEFFTNTIQSIVTGIRDGFNRVDWGGIGMAIMQGIANGIGNAGGMVADAARHAAEDAFNSAKNFLGIGSPSKLAADELGAPFVEGFAQGIQTALHRATVDIGGGLNGMMAGLTAGMVQPAPAAMGAGAGGANLTQNFYGPADAAGVGGASRSGVLAGLRLKGVR